MSQNFRAQPASLYGSGACTHNRRRLLAAAAMLGIIGAFSAPALAQPQSKSADGDGSRFGLSSKPRATEFVELTRFSGALSGLPDATFEHQIQIHRAHTVMLAKQGIISKDEAAAILSGLGAVNTRAEKDPKLRSYMVYETALIKEVGSPAGKMHIGRSRNDLQHTYNRMYYRDRINGLIEDLNKFRSVLISKAGENVHTVMMVYTHAKQAQPVTLGHYLMAHAEALGKHIQRYEDLYKRMNQNPLGSAASAGTGWPLDREFTTKLLGFDGLVVNTIEGVAGWDHIAEFATANSIVMSGLTRLATEMTYWQTDEFNMIDLDGAYTGNSSIMPQKKIPARSRG